MYWTSAVKREVVVVSGVRTAAGTLGGSLKDLSPPNSPQSWALLQVHVAAEFLPCHVRTPRNWGARTWRRPATACWRGTSV